MSKSKADLASLSTRELLAVARQHVAAADYSSAMRESGGIIGPPGVRDGPLHKGLLKNQPPDVQQKTIEGRIKELERQLEKQRSELEKINEAIRALPRKN